MPYFFAGLLSLFLIAGSVFAQQTRSLSLDQAIEIALENNVQIKRSLNNVERQEINVQRSRAEFLPNVNSNFSGGRTVGRQFDQATVQFDDFTINNINSAVSTSVTLFSGWQNVNNLRAGRSSLDAAEDDYERTRESIIFGTASEFLQVLLSEELLKIAQENLDASRQQLELVEAQVAEGMRPIVDQYNQEATVANNELMVIQRENQLNFNIVRLVGLLQIDPMQEYNFISPGIDEDALLPKDYRLTELVEQAMANRRDIRATEKFIQSRQYSLEAARGAYLPTVSLGVSLSTRYNDQQRMLNPEFGNQPGAPEFIHVPFTDQFFDQNINRGISFNVSIPIFNRMNIRTNVQQQEIDYKNALLDMESLRVEVFQEIRQAYNDYVSIVKELESTATAERAAEKAYETEQARYNLGSSTLIELTEANNRYVEAVSNRVQAQYRFVFQEKLLDFYIGRITPQDMEDMFN